MLKWLAAAVVVALLLVAGLAVGFYHFWGWKGLIAFHSCCQTICSITLPSTNVSRSFRPK